MLVGCRVSKGESFGSEGRRAKRGVGSKTSKQRPAPRASYAHIARAVRTCRVVAPLGPTEG
eukprot:4170915-Pleurochrysis_carterae.AAC.1